MKRNLGLQMEEDLIAAIDAARGETSRQRWVAEACQARLGMRTVVPGRDPETAVLDGTLVRAEAPPVTPASRKVARALAPKDGGRACPKCKTWIKRANARCPKVGCSG